MINNKRLIRTSWQVLIASVYSLIIRNLELRFVMRGSNKRLLDLLMIIAEPAGHILLWSTIRLFKYPTLDGGISLPLFILLGVMPWQFTFNTIGDCMSIITQNRNLLFFKQIKPLDPTIALVFSEFIMMAFVFTLALVVFSYFNIWHIQHSLRWFIAIILYFIFVAGMAVLITCIGFFSKPIARLSKTLLRVLYLFSGIFFSAQMVSPHTRQFFILNPLFQFIEISRECFSNNSNYNGFGSLYYLFECALSSIFLGLAAYTLLRKKIMIEIMEH